MNGKKKLIVLLAAIVVAVAAVVGVVLSVVSCKDKNNSESGNNGIAKNAEYYCVAEDDEYVVTLTSSKTYFLSVAGEQKTGDYTLNESGELKLSVDGNEVSATIKNDELAITYGGKSYTLLEKIKRSVTFDNDGATTGETVLNGKSVEKPADPTDKDGEKFVGWYTSKDYKEVYNFAMPVRADITVYAQHVKLAAGAKEFTVTLKDGSDKEIQTTNGVVYGLESLAGKDGKEFDGWYVSDFNDEAKLTYKYNGEVLKQNVNLYPVWKGEISGISVTGSKISWKSDGTSFNVKITDSDNVPDTLRTTQAYLDYDFRKKGEYKIEISKTGSDSVSTIYYNSKALARVSDITILDGGMLIYSSVDDAEEYEITVDCGNKDHKHSGVSNGVCTYFDISGCDMQQGGIKITVVAKASGYASSVAEYVYEKNLEKVSAVEVKDGKLIWSQVKNALGYVVTVNGEKIEVGNVTEYSLKNYSTGDYELGVYPVTKGYNSPEATETTYTKSNLLSPTGIAVNGNVIKWDEVEGASGYELDINGRSLLSDYASFTLKDEYFTDNVIQLKVKALGETIDDSDYSDVKTISYNSLSGLNYANGVFSWNSVYVAGRYEVSVNGTDVVKTDAETTDVKVKFKKSGSNEISVKYFFADGSAGQTKSIYVDAYTVRFVGNNGQTKELYLAKGDTIEYSEFAVAGYEFSGWYNVPSGGKNNGSRITTATLEKSSDLIMYAYYVSQAYEVTLDGLDEVVSVRFNETYKLDVPVSDDVNLTFGGWYSGINGTGYAYTDADGVGLGNWSTAYSTTLYPSWIKVFDYILDNSGNGYRVIEGPGLPYVTSAVVQASVEGKTVLSVDSLADATRLKTITIPDTVTNIAMGANLGVSSSVFAQCTSLESIIIESTGKNSEPVYYSDGGVLYSVTYKDGDNGDRAVAAQTLIVVPLGKGGTLELTSGTTAISNYALSGSALEKVVIPSTVTSVGDGAFADCKRLVEVKFLAEEDGEKAKELTFGSLVFDGCTALEALALPGRLGKSEYSYSDSNYKWSMNFDLTLLEDSYGLETIEVVGTNVNYSSVDGMLASADGTTIIYCPKGRSKAVDLPHSVTSVGNGAFKKCSFISEVTIPGSVTYIGFDAFKDCSKISSFVFTGDANDEGLTIESGAIYSTSNLYSIVLPENLVSLKAYSINSYSLKTVTINSVGTEVGGVYSVDFSKNAFGTLPVQATSVFYVQDINIGAKVPAFEITSVFGDKIQQVNVDANNTNFRNQSGVLYSADGAKLLYYPDNGNSVFNIPEGVKEISANMFRENETLIEVSIPSSVETIGDNAFYRCTNLTTVTIADGDKDLAIGLRAFYNCTALKAITLPSRLVELGEESFYHDYDLAEVVFNNSKITEIKSKTFDTCRSLTEVTIPDGVTTLASESFARCFSLTTVNLSSTVETIGTNAFYLSDELAEIVVDENNETYANESGLLYKKTNGVVTELIFCPVNCSGEDGVVTIPKTVTYIGTGVFSGNLRIEEIYFEDHEAGADGKVEEITLGTKLFYNTKNLKKIHLPEGLKTINRNVFWQSGAEEIEIPSTVTTIMPEAFYMAVNLKKLTFADSEEPLTIENGESSSGYASSMYGAFYTCSALEELILPERTVKIGSYAFYMNPTDGKSNLKKVYIPSGVTEIGMYAFYGCNGLTDLTFGEDSKLKQVCEYTFYNTTKLKTVKLPSTVTDIGAYAFAFSGLTSIELPESLTSISSYDKYKNSGYGAFYGCTDLASVVVKSNNSLTIDEKSFADCDSLTSVEIKNSDITFEVGDSAFSNTALTSFAFPSGTQKIGKTAFKFTSLETVTFNVDDSEVSALTEIGDEAFAGTNITEFALPMTEASVTLGKELFKGCVGLTTVRLPASQSSLGEALNGCVTIESITVDGDSDYMTVENGILYNKDKTSVYYVFAHYIGLLDLSSITNISDGAYAGQTDITKVIISEKTLMIGKDAFKNCTSLKEVEFVGGAPSLTAISEGAFENCSALETITLPNYIETIGKDAFKNCTSLKTVTFGENVKDIGESSFENTALETVTLPQTLEEVGMYAFANTSLTSVTIPASVTTLGIKVVTSYTSRTNIETLESYAFYGCDKLKTVTFAGDINAIGAYAFASTAIEAVEVPASVEELGDGVFSGCTLLTDVSFAGNKLTIINESMFRGCTSLRSIEIPEGITNIKAYAFMDCSKLSSVELPSTLNAMYSESKYNGDMADYMITAMYPNYGYQFANCTSLKEIDIPDSVTYIGSYAFRNSGLVKIELPSSLKYLTAQNMSLSALASMSKTNFLRGTTASSMSDYYMQYQSAQFADCKDLEEIILPAGLESLGIRTFWNTPKLKTLTYKGAEGKNALPETLKYMAAYQFSGSGLESITIPNSVSFYTSPQVFVFAESGLKSVDMSGCTFTQLINYMFYNASNLEEVKLPDTVTSIGNYSFTNCSSLSSFELPSTVKTIGNYAFQNTGLVTIDLSNVTSFGTSGNQFNGCTSLKAVTLNSALTSLPQRMFYKCTSLTSISLPSALTAIKSSCFEESGLKTIYITKNLTSIASKALASNSLVSISVDEKNEKYTVTNGILIENGSTILLCPKVPETENGVLTIPEGVVNISSYAFNGNTTIKSVVLPSTLTTIPSYAFACMYGLEEIVIPETVTTIGNGAFYKCENLKSIKIPSSVKSLEGGSAFSGCANLESVDLSEVDSDIVLGVNTFAGTGITSIDLSALNITILPDGLFRSCTKLVDVKLPEGIVYMGGGTFYGCSSLETIDIPASVKYLAGEDAWGESVCDSDSQTFTDCTSLKNVNFLGNEVVVIGDGSFMNCTSLESITLPSSVQYIYGGKGYTRVDNDYLYNGAFKNSGLKEITIPENVTTIDQYVFAECENLSKVNGGVNVTSIGMHAFDGCSSLKSYTVGEKITTIGEKAFVSSGLETVEVKSVATFGYSVFESCESLTSVTFAAGTKSLNHGMFKNCISLKQITLPSGLRSIPISAFENSGLESITIPGSVKAIYENAFADCAALSSVKLENGVNEIYSGAFAGCTSLKKLTIPATVYTLNAESNRQYVSYQFTTRPTFEGWTENQTVELKLAKYQAIKVFDIDWLNDCGIKVIYG